ncbi:2OG-Fe dioxygenase family protein [Bradyrhizobium sp. USDA 223]|uniref:2OG-Fe dioxygenase family protein n=1 Tax=Bradyrhizobium sp. USDA 223 TaxID=3156306 RepID=UPI003838CEEF
MKDVSSAQLDEPYMRRYTSWLDGARIAAGQGQIEQVFPVVERPHPTIERYRDALERDGFACEAGENIQLVVSATAMEWITKARDAGRNGPIDQNPGGREAGRHRYHSVGVYLKHAAAGMRFLPCPPFVDGQGTQFTTFLQPSGMNRDYSAERRFDPLPEDLIRHKGLQEIVDFCFQATPSSLFPNGARDWMRTGLHLISLHAEETRPGISSPNRAHVDGELSTTIVMLERMNVIGGESLIVSRAFADAHPNEIPLEHRRASVTLEQTLDILTVDDRRLAHYVSPVFARKSTRGFRTVLLVDFTPLVPVTSDQLLKWE